MGELRLLVHSGPAASILVIGLGSGLWLGPVSAQADDDPPLLCNGLAATVDIGAGEVPTIGNDVIVGTPDSDVINGLAGTDTIWGFGGADLLSGGGGADTIYGGDGDDTINGHGGPDSLHGG